MQKLTKQHKLAIINTMFADLASYVNIYCTDNKDVDNTNMYCGDIVHNTNALDEFFKTNNVQQLHESIMLQDTLVREHFINTLRYIEENNLISPRYFACM